MTIKTLLLAGIAVMMTSGIAIADSRVTTVGSHGVGTTTHYYDDAYDDTPVQEEEVYVEDQDDDADVEDRVATKWYPVPTGTPVQRTHVVYTQPNVVYTQPDVVYAEPDNGYVTTTTESYVVVDKNHETMSQARDWENGRYNR